MTNGPIKLVSLSGSITIHGGSDGLGISANGSGDVLLEARGSGSNVVIISDVVSDRGNITLIAANHVTTSAVVRTDNNGVAGEGEIYIQAVGGAITIGGVIDSKQTTGTGDILLRAGQDITLSTMVTSGGKLGLLAGDDVFQNAAGDVQAAGDILVTSANATNDGDPNDGVIMADGAATTSTGGNILAQASRGGDIRLGLLSVGTMKQVSLNAAGDILDNNIPNTDDVNVIAGRLSMTASGIIGGAGGTITTANSNAIDTQVGTIAASSANGIYIQELAVGGNITVNSIALLDVALDVTRADFNSGTSQITPTATLTALEDLTTTTNGPIKVVAENGTITISGGTTGTPGVSAEGTGDVLLEAGGASSDVIVNAGVLSDSGNITLIAADSVTTSAEIRTDNNGVAGEGEIYIQAVGGAITIGGVIDSKQTTGTGDVLLSAGQDITLSAMVTSGGKLGLLAGDDVFQNAAGDVQAAGDILVTSANATNDGDPNDGVIMADGAATTSTGGNILVQASRGGDIRLGLLSVGTMKQVSLNAAGDILDNNIPNTDDVNVIAGRLSMTAGGIIGGAGGTMSSSNAAAIDTQVGVVAASSSNGIYIQELTAGGNITVNSIALLDVALDVTRADFNSGTSQITPTATLTALEDLTTTTSGPIKVVAENGTITISGGTTGTPGVSAEGTGDVLLEAGGASSDVIVNAGVLSDSGNITLIAADSVTTSAEIRTDNNGVAGEGEIYIQAVGGAITIGGVIDSKQTTGTGDVLLRAGQDITLSAMVTSGGKLGLLAGDDVFQNAAGDVQAAGDILVTSANATNHGDPNDGVIMADGAATTSTGGNILAQASRGGDIRLGLLSVGTMKQVSLNAAGDILDNNIPNTDDVNVIAGRLSMTAGGIIGGAGGTMSSSNAAAIDTQVGVVAASSSNGIYIQELTAGGNVTVSSIAQLDVGLDVTRADFDSGTSEVTFAKSLSAMEDLTTTGGPIKLVADYGTITINGGTNSSGVNANGSGDVLLDARGTGSDIQLNAHVTSSTGNIRLLAADSISLTANVDVTTTSSGTIDMQATAGTFTMHRSATLNTVGGDIRIQTDGNVTIGDITAANANVWLISDSASILDADADDTDTDVTSIGLRLNAAIGVGTLGAGNNAIETNVTTVTARATSGGINILETDDIIVGDVTVNTHLPEFNSTTTPNPGTTQSDLRITAGNGDIVLRSLAGNIVLNDGSPPGDGNAVVAAGNGNVLIEAAGAGKNITANADINGGRGNITITANHSVTLNDDVRTTADGTVLVEAVNGSITLNDGSDGDETGITTIDGDILLQAVFDDADIIINSDINSTSGDIGVNAGRNIVQTVTAITADISTGGHVSFAAANDITMDSGTTINAGTNILLNAGNDIRLGLLDATNVSLNATNGSVLDNNGGDAANVRATHLRITAGDSIGTAAGNAGLPTNANAIDLEVTRVAARSSNGIYLRELATGSDIAVDEVAEMNVQIDVARINARRKRN